MVIRGRVFEEEDLATLVMEFRAMLKRGLRRELGDCYAYWEYDSQKLLDKTICFATDATETSATKNWPHTSATKT